MWRCRALWTCLLLALAVPASAQIPISNLCGTATITSTANGPWSTPSTWDLGRVPTSSETVSIASGTTVTGGGAAGCVTVQNGGIWQFDGTFTVGGVHVKPSGEFSSSLPFNVSIGNTILIEGKAYWIAAARTAWERHQDVVAGATTATFTAPVTNWVSGDLVAFFDTRLSPNCANGGCYKGAQREVKTVQSVAGAVVTFTTPFQFSHLSVTSQFASPDTTFKTMRPWANHIGGTSTFRSATPAGQRGTIRAVNRADIWLEGVSLLDLGRATGPNHPLFLDNLTGPVAPQSNGRQWTLDMVEVARAPRWCIVATRANYGLIDNTATYDCAKAHLVFDTGAEWENIVRDSSFVFSVGNGNRDSAEAGIGIYQRGPGNYILRNWTANNYNSVQTEGAYGYKLWAVQLGNVVIPASQGAFPSVTVNANLQALKQFEGNWSFADDSGFTFWWVGIAGIGGAFNSTTSTIKDLRCVNEAEACVFQYEMNRAVWDGMIARGGYRLWKGQDYIFRTGTIQNWDVQGFTSGFEISAWMDGTETLLKDSQIQTSQYNIGRQSNWASGVIAPTTGGSLRVRNVTHLGSAKQFTNLNRSGSSNHIAREVTFVECHQGDCTNNFEWFAPLAAANAILAQTAPVGCVPGGSPPGNVSNACGRIGSPVAGQTNAQNFAARNLWFEGQQICAAPQTSSAFDGFACGTAPQPPIPPTPCGPSFTVTPTTGSVPAAGGSFVVTITPAVAGCTAAWAVTGVSAGLTVTPMAGAGLGTVTVTASANGNTSARTLTATIAGTVVTVTQPGSTCTYLVSPSSVTFPATGGTQLLTITASLPSCTWTVSGFPTWVTASVTGGVGSGTTVLSAPNITRSGSGAVAGQTITVQQP